jgi:hypothetical protein
MRDAGTARPMRKGTTPFTSVAFQTLNGLVNTSDYGPLLADVVLVAH